MIDANKDKRNEINEKLRQRIVDMADIWDGEESQKYGQRLYDVLNDLGIHDVPKFYSKENINRMIKELDAQRIKDER